MWGRVAFFVLLMVVEALTVVCRTTTPPTTPSAVSNGDNKPRKVKPTKGPSVVKPSAKATPAPKKADNKDDLSSTAGNMADELNYEYGLPMVPPDGLAVAENAYDGRPLTLKDILPEDPSTYDKMRPPKKEGRPCTVYFHVTVMSLDSINENSMTYVADVFFAQAWEDHRLRFPENMTSEYRLLEVEWLHALWRPDSFFKNAKQVTFQTMTIPNHYVWLYKNRKILYMVKLTLMLSCPMNFVYYPHDTQECKLQMESLSHTVDDLIFEWDLSLPLDVSTSIELPQLELMGYYKADCTQVYSTGNFTCLEAVFTLKRRLGYYLFHTYIPTCLIVIMSWVSFWIKPEAAPARVTLGVTSLLTLSTQHAKSQSSLPPVSYIKAIDVFMSSCTVFVFLALMEYALVNVLLGDTAAEAVATREAAATKQKEKEKQELETADQQQKAPTNKEKNRFRLMSCSSEASAALIDSSKSHNFSRRSTWESSFMGKKFSHPEHQQDYAGDRKREGTGWSESTLAIGGFGFGLGLAVPPSYHQQQRHNSVKSVRDGGRCSHHSQRQPGHQHHHYGHDGHYQEPDESGHYHSPRRPRSIRASRSTSPHVERRCSHHQRQHKSQQHEQEGPSASQVPFHHVAHTCQNAAGEDKEQNPPMNLPMMPRRSTGDDSVFLPPPPSSEEGLITARGLMVMNQQLHLLNPRGSCWSASSSSIINTAQQMNIPTINDKQPAIDISRPEEEEEEEDMDEDTDVPDERRLAVISPFPGFRRRGKQENKSGSPDGRKESFLGDFMMANNTSNDNSGISEAGTPLPPPSSPACLFEGNNQQGNQPAEGADEKHDGLTPQQMKAVEMASAMDRRRKALAVDRFSRYFFPVSFGLLNCIYWLAFASY